MDIVLVLVLINLLQLFRGLFIHVKSLMCRQSVDVARIYIYVLSFIFVVDYLTDGYLLIIIKVKYSLTIHRSFVLFA